MVNIDSKPVKAVNGGAMQNENNDEVAQINRYIQVYTDSKMDDAARYSCEEKLKQMVHSNISVRSKQYLYDKAMKAFQDGYYTGGIIEEFTKEDVPSELRQKLVDFSLKNISSSNANFRLISSKNLLDFVRLGISTELKAKSLDVVLREIGHYSYGKALPQLKMIMDEVMESDKSPVFQKEMINVILPYLNDQSPIVRKYATDMLGQYVDENAPLEIRTKMAEALIGSLNDSDPEVVSNAIWALGLLAKTNISMDLKNRIINRLIDVMDTIAIYKEWKPKIQSSVARALGQFMRENISTELKSKIKENLTGLLSSNIPIVKLTAEEALKNINK